MKHVILGTAGHIDHGKTALVGALTGADTDRLKEEKARGITIELGFAELVAADGSGLGVVDVPGHEGFVRTMVAGATGMDVVLLVVAADEGIMPQTREHVAILRLLGVQSMVVALTKADLVDEEWLALVDDDVRGFLADTPYAESPRIPVSSVTGEGLDVLRRTLESVAGSAAEDRSQDLTRLPVDRVFTVQGTGTVVTGTLWSGRLTTEDRVRILPGDAEARVRALQVHGRPVDQAGGGDRTAVALSGSAAQRDDLPRGRWLVTDPAWDESWMLTVHVELLPDAPWPLVHNQRVRVHVGTAEVLGRVALLEGGVDGVAPGGHGWIQLRLEEPVMARCRDRVILRSYSPMHTLGGGVVAEPVPQKRRRLALGESELLSALAFGDDGDALAALLASASWSGVERHRLPVLLGRPPAACHDVVEQGPGAHLVAGGLLFGPAVVTEGTKRMLQVLDAEHAADSLSEAVPLSRVRTALPAWAHPKCADALLEHLVDSGAVELVGGGVRKAGFAPSLTGDQEEACARLTEVFAQAGLAAPAAEELPDDLVARDDLWSLLRHLERAGVLTAIADGSFVDAATLTSAQERVQDELGGREGLGPTEFRDILDVSRKHLIPLLNYFDGIGLTLREDGKRRVPPR